jgi:hypothetical protein
MIFVIAAFRLISLVFAEAAKKKILFGIERGYVIFSNAL